MVLDPSKVIALAANGKSLVEKLLVNTKNAKIVLRKLEKSTNPTQVIWEWKEDSEFLQEANAFGQIIYLCGTEFVALLHDFRMLLEEILATLELEGMSVIYTQTSGRIRIRFNDELFEFKHTREENGKVGLIHIGNTNDKLRKRENRVVLEIAEIYSMDYKVLRSLAFIARSAQEQDILAKSEVIAHATRSHSENFLTDIADCAQWWKTAISSLEYIQEAVHKGLTIDRTVQKELRGLVKQEKKVVALGEDTKGIVALRVLQKLGTVTLKLGADLVGIGLISNIAEVINDKELRNDLYSLSA